MKTGRIGSLGIGLVSLLLTSCTAPGAENTIAAPAEATGQAALTIFTGGTIYTGIEGAVIDMVAIDDAGRIVALAPPASENWDSTEVTVIDLDGAVMFPGFVDGHAHLLGIGQRELSLNLEGIASIGELVTRVEAELVGKPDGQVLFGSGWIETDWPEGRMVLASDLDAVSPNHPVILERADGHAVVVNGAALALAGIDATTLDPDGGRIERGLDGAATGILVDHAIRLVLGLLNEPDETELLQTYRVGAAEYASRGWTGVHNMSVDPDHAPLLQQLDNAGEMPLRLHNAFKVDGFELAAARQFETETITNRAVKVFMDGALGSRGALLIEPYSDRPDTSGLALMEPEALGTLMARAEDANVQLAIHAIGDLANRRILDEFERLQSLAPEAGSQTFDHTNRWRIEHTQILHPDDIARVGGLGLIASMQPSHAIGDLKFAPDRLGMDRLAGAYAWASLLNSGALVVGGSDAPVEIGTPQIEFYGAVARKGLDGFSGEGWHPEQALTRDMALALFTSAPAYAAFMEDELGTIEIGKRADFTVFDRDLMTIPEADILNAEVVMTVVQGDIVYARD